MWDMGLSVFDNHVAEFLRLEKATARRPRWRTVNHPDYAEAAVMVGAPSSRTLRGYLILTAHRVRLPPKYGFSLAFRGERILALDVNPGRSHRNLLTGKLVTATHWQRWPKMEAESDDREQNFAMWLREFCRQCNVSIDFLVKVPPRGVQLGLLYDDDSKGRRS